MKKVVLILSVIGLIVLMVSCNTGSGSAKETSIAVSPSDTVGFAAFREWKMKSVEAPVVVATTQSTHRVVSRKTYPRTVSMTDETRNTAKAPVKKGWSKAAKGTAIGAGGGAILGAVINKKNRAIGAAIGGVLGGGIGYGIGRHLDKKDGR